MDGHIKMCFECYVTLQLPGDKRVTVT